MWYYLEAVKYRRFAVCVSSQSVSGVPSLAGVLSVATPLVHARTQVGKPGLFSVFVMARAGTEPPAVCRAPTVCHGAPSLSSRTDGAGAAPPGVPLDVAAAASAAEGFLVETIVVRDGAAAHTPAYRLLLEEMGKVRPTGHAPGAASGL